MVHTHVENILVGNLVSSTLVWRLPSYFFGETIFEVQTFGSFRILEINFKILTPGFQLQWVGGTLRLSTRPRDRVQNGETPRYKGLCQNQYRRCSISEGNAGRWWQGGVTAELTHSSFGISEVRSLPGVDTTGLATSLPTLSVGLACHGRSSEHVGEKQMSLGTGGILFVGMISKSAPPSELPLSFEFLAIQLIYMTEKKYFGLSSLVCSESSWCTSMPYYLVLSTTGIGKQMVIYPDLICLISSFFLGSVCTYLIEHNCCQQIFSCRLLFEYDCIQKEYIINKAYSKRLYYKQIQSEFRTQVLWRWLPQEEYRKWTSPSACLTYQLKYFMVHHAKMFIPKHGTPHFWKLWQQNGRGTIAAVATARPCLSLRSCTCARTSNTMLQARSLTRPSGNSEMKER